MKSKPLHLLARWFIGISCTVYFARETSGRVIANQQNVLFEEAGQLSDGIAPFGFFALLDNLKFIGQLSDDGLRLLFIQPSISLEKDNPIFPDQLDFDFVDERGRPEKLTVFLHFKNRLGPFFEFIQTFTNSGKSNTREQKKQEELHGSPFSTLSREVNT